VCSHSLLGFSVDDSVGLAEVTVDAGDAYACSVIGELEASAADDVVFADDGALARGVDVYDDVALGGETRVQGTPIFNGYRALIPQLGVYTSPDPLHRMTVQQHAGAGAYSYVANRPFVLQDPHGQVGVAVLPAAGAVSIPLIVAEGVGITGILFCVFNPQICADLVDEAVDKCTPKKPPRRGRPPDNPCDIKGAKCALCCMTNMSTSPEEGGACVAECVAATALCHEGAPDSALHQVAMCWNYPTPGGPVH
jgi:RHS repeat-associated protein